jgi:hypothetical protein
MISQSRACASTSANLRPLFVVATLSLALPACTTAGNHSSFAEKSLPMPSFAALQVPQVSERHPLIRLPNSGALVSVDGTESAAGLRQEIVYRSADTSSRIDVRVRTDGARGGLVEKPTRAMIQAELARLASGPYQIVTRPSRNRYGPLGIATSDRCAYAWQWIEDLRSYETTLPRASRAMPAALRIEHCRTRQAPRDGLIADLEQMEFAAGRRDTTYRGVRRSRRTASPHTATASQPTAGELVPAPTVEAPQPTVRVNANRTLIIDTPASQAPASARPVDAAPRIVGEVPSVPRPGAIGGGLVEQRRYLADQPSASGERRAAEPPVPASSTRPSPNESLNGNLPPQAYRGPSAAPYGW